MFDRVLNMPLPGKERKDMRDVWTVTIDRSVVTKAMHTCCGLFYPSLFLNGKAGNISSVSSKTETSDTETIDLRR